MTQASHLARNSSTGSFSGHRTWGLLAFSVIAALFFVVPTAAATDGDAYVLSSVQCDPNHNGVLDLTLVNAQADVEANFDVAEVHTAGNQQFTVAANSASAVTFNDLADGALAVAVAVDGVPSVVSVDVRCDGPEFAVLVGPVPESNLARSLPSTGSSTGGLVIAAAMVLAGIIASLIARRRYS